jgi:predicted nucleotide-binding protein
LVTAQRERVRVFIISSAEAIPVVDLLIRQFEHDPFLAVAWKNGVFRASNYTLDEMDDELERSDFAIAVAHSDDVVITRNDEWPTVRDNVIFELGMFMGRLGRRRAFLMEPRDVDLKLPSDLAGLTAIPYRYEKGRDAEHLIAPACARLRDLILAAGPKG